MKQRECVQSLVPPTKKFQSIPVKSVAPGTSNFEEVLKDIFSIVLDCTNNLWDTRAIKHELVEEWMVRVTVSEDDTTNREDWDRHCILDSENYKLLSGSQE